MTERGVSGRMPARAARGTAGVVVPRSSTRRLRRVHRGTMPASSRSDRPRVSAVAFAIGLMTLLSLVLVFGGTHYFNTFVNLEQNVHTALAQIDRELQRRSDLVESLVPAVFEYAALERRVFTDVAKVRAASGDDRPADEADNTPGSTPGQPATPTLLEQLVALAEPGQGDALARLMAVSERYPDMKSSAPFTVLMGELAMIEDRIAKEREQYNDSVNIYTTATASFPGRVFAQLFGFDDFSLFEAGVDARGVPRIEWPRGVAR